MDDSWSAEICARALEWTWVWEFLNETGMYRISTPLEFQVMNVEAKSSFFSTYFWKIADRTATENGMTIEGNIGNPYMPALVW